MGILIYTPKRYAISEITCAKMNHRYDIIGEWALDSN